MNLDKFINKFKYIEEDWTGQDAFNESPKRRIRKENMKKIQERKIEKSNPVKFKEEVDKMVESILDEPRDRMNENIWEYKEENDLPILRQDAKQSIMNGMSDILKVSNKEPETILIIGSTTGYRYDDKSDIDVSIKLNLTDEEIDEIMPVIIESNEKYLTGTQHPINYYVINRDLSLNLFDAAYDVMNDKWIKKPRDYGVDLFNVYDDFKKYISKVDVDEMEMKRDVIDSEKIFSAIKNGGNLLILTNKLKQKLDGLNDVIEKLSNEYDETHKKRIEAFKNFDPENSKLDSPNLLPENIKYKLLERYAYLDFMSKLNKLVKETGKIDTEEDLEKVKEILQNYGN